MYKRQGYALTKYSFKGKNLMFAVIMLTMMIPGQVLYVPLFTMISGMGWTNTYSSVAVSYTHLDVYKRQWYSSKYSSSLPKPTMPTPMPISRGRRNSRFLLKSLNRLPGNMVLTLH